MTALHLVMFGVSACSLAAAALRWSCRLADGLAPRILGAASLLAAIIVSESLLLGLAGQGTTPLTLTIVALLTWVASRLLVVGPSPAVRKQIADWWSGHGAGAHAAIGSALFVIGGTALFQLAHPVLGGDGLIDHAAQPAIWLGDGRPGSLHQTIANFPTQAYPRTMEVLVGWTYALGRTPLAAVPLTIGLSVLAVAAVVVGLRWLGVRPVIAVVAAAAGLLLPVDVLEVSGIYTDLPALAWLACAVALSVCCAEEPAAIGLAAVAGGLAIGTKPTTAPFVLVGLAFAVWVNRDRLWSVRRLLVVPLGLALALGAVWYVVDWHVYGSPLWPFSRFPSGRPIPVVWQQYGARFIDHPVAAIRALGWHLSVRELGGGLLLLAAIPLLALGSLLPGARRHRRTALIGGGLVVLEVLLWGDSEFTGYSHHNIVLLLSGLRYLTPAPLAAAAVLALATRGRTFLGLPSAALLAAALALDLWELRQPKLGVPLRPDVPMLVALLAAGAVAGLLAGHVGVRQVLDRRWLVPVAVIAAAATMAVPASSYLHRYLLTAQRHGYADAPLLRYLSQQPGWAHGDAPVAAGHLVYASLAGPRFTHPLSYIADDESCAAIRSAARRGWVILQPIRDAPYAAMDYLAAPACMSGIRPVAQFAGGVKVYAPLRLTEDP